MRIFFKPVAALLLLALATPMGQVLAQKTARLSVSAIVTGKCSIRQRDNAYTVVCSNGTQAPRTVQPVSESIAESWADSLAGSLTVRPETSRRGATAITDGSGGSSSGSGSGSGSRQDGTVILLY